MVCNNNSNNNAKCIRIFEVRPIHADCKSNSLSNNCAIARPPDRPTPRPPDRLTYGVIVWRSGSHSLFFMFFSLLLLWCLLVASSGRCMNATATCDCPRPLEITWGDASPLVHQLCWPSTTKSRFLQFYFYLNYNWVWQMTSQMVINIISIDLQ